MVWCYKPVFMSMCRSKGTFVTRDSVNRLINYLKFSNKILFRYGFCHRLVWIHNRITNPKHLRQSLLLTWECMYLDFNFICMRKLFFKSCLRPDIVCCIKSWISCPIACSTVLIWWYFKTLNLNTHSNVSQS